MSDEQNKSDVAVLAAEISHLREHISHVGRSVRQLRDSHLEAHGSIRHIAGQLGEHLERSSSILEERDKRDDLRWDELRGSINRHVDACTARVAAVEINLAPIQSHVANMQQFGHIAWRIAKVVGPLALGGIGAWLGLG